MLELKYEAGCEESDHIYLKAIPVKISAVFTHS